MRSAIIAALIGAAAAIPLTETIYDTKVYTITSCGPEVTDCPARKSTSTTPVTTTCTEEAKKTTYTAPPVYVTSSAAVVSSSAVKVVSSSAAVVTSSAPAPPPYVWSSEAAKSSTQAPPPPPPAVTSSAAQVTSQAPPPPPYQWSTGVVSKSTPVVTGITNPVTYPGTVSTGVPPVTKTSSAAYWSKTTAPATYTGAASNVQAAGLVMGAGAIAALFL